jgi:acetyltransferase
MESARRIAARAVSEGREWLTAPEIAALFDAYDIPIAAARAAGTPEEAREIAARLLDGHEAVVVKIMSPDIQHKTDVNGVGSSCEPGGSGAAARSVMEAAARMRPRPGSTGSPSSRWSSARARAS